MDPASDGIDIAAMARTLRRQWRAVLTCLVLGVVIAAAVVLFAPRRFEGRATLLARTIGSEAGGTILGRLTSVGALMGSGPLGGLPSPFETELQVLRSRAVAGRVVDSLLLQASVRSPGGIAPRALFSALDLPGRYKPRRYRFERGEGGKYTVVREGVTYTLTPGEPGKIDIGTVTLMTGDLPASFGIKVYDREDAITRFSIQLEANKAGGEVARVVYRGEDSLTAAIAPNLVVAYYLERRRTVDRGTNQRRLEYVTEQLESAQQELAQTERTLRTQQETSGVFDAETVGKAWLEGAVALRESLTTTVVDEATINKLLSQTESGALSPRQLAAYPAFMRGTAVSSLAGQITDMESQRTRMLERRTMRDPEVMVLTDNIKAVENQIIAQAKSYSNAVMEHRIGLTRQLDSIRISLQTLPAAAERGGRLQRDVIRNTAIYTALQAQLVEARLAAIGEGGDVRQIDFAVPQRKPAFPLPLLTMAIGVLGGLLVGAVTGLLQGWFGRWLRDPDEIERMTGVAVQRFDPHAPLLVAGTATRTLLVVPLGKNADVRSVVQRLAQTATARALRANVLDLSATNGNGSDPASHPAAQLQRMESEGDVVVVQLPGISEAATVAALRENRPVLLVAPPGPVDRVRLASTLDALRQFGVPCAGVIITDPIRRLRG